MRHVRFVRHRDCARPEHTVHSVLLGQLPLLGTSGQLLTLQHPAQLYLLLPVLGVLTLSPSLAGPSLLPSLVPGSPLHVL